MTDRSGFLYILLFDDMKTIKVGMSSNPTTRKKDMSKLLKMDVKLFNVSEPIEDVERAEKQLLSIAKFVCGIPISGRELFSGDEKKFVELVSASKCVALENGHLTNIGGVFFKEVTVSVSVCSCNAVYRRAKDIGIKPEDIFKIAMFNGIKNNLP